MNIKLNTPFASAIALAVATLGTGSVLAQDSSAPKTRDQVKAELVQAQRSGDVIADDLGQKLNEVNPRRYPAQAAAQGRSRAEVKAELLEAQRRGGVIVTTESGQNLNDLYPGRSTARSRTQ